MYSVLIIEIPFLAIYIIFALSTVLTWVFGYYYLFNGPLIKKIFTFLSTMLLFFTVLSAIYLVFAPNEYSYFKFFSRVIPKFLR